MCELELHLDDVADRDACISTRNPFVKTHVEVRTILDTSE